MNRSSAKGLMKARRSQQKQALKLWEHIGETKRSDAWKGRLLVLVWLHDNRVTFDIKVDIFERSQSKWLGLHGWQGPTPKPVVVLAPDGGDGESVPAAASTQATQRGQDQNAMIEPQAAQRGHGQKRKRPWIDVEKELFPDPESPGGKRSALFAFRPKSQVCVATEVFRKAGLSKLHIGQDLSRWAKLDRPKWVLDKEYGKAAPGVWRTRCLVCEQACCTVSVYQEIVNPTSSV